MIFPNDATSRIKYHKNVMYVSSNNRQVLKKNLKNCLRLNLCMPIVATDIKYYYSGGSGNTDPNASIGGAISTTQITTNVDNNLFDDVTGAEASAGDTEYRCVYVKNTHGSITLASAVVWIDTNTPSTDDTVAIGLAPEGDNGTAEAVANESTAPATVTFSSPSSKATGLSLGSLASGHYYAIWIRRVVSASASAYNANSFILKVEGDTTA